MARASQPVGPMLRGGVAPDGAPLTQPQRKGCNGGTFAAPWPGGDFTINPLTALKWKCCCCCAGGSRPPRFPTAQEASTLVPTVDSILVDALQAPPSDGVQATWTGHASFCVQVHGVNILTDPVWEERASFVQFAGPKRYVPPPMPLDTLPRVDVVSISHNHYDHLCTTTVRRLVELFDPAFVVPLGMKQWFESVFGQGHAVLANVHEASWYECVSLHLRGTPLHVTVVPVQHWSMRTGPWDRNTQLWCGFVYEVEGGSDQLRRIFHGGDTGYSATVFQEIGRVFGRFDLAMIPIGAYQPRWMMQDQHVDPAEAVQIHLDLNRPTTSLGMHWGTFILTDEPVDEPPQLLRDEAAMAGLAAGEFVALMHGETVVVV